MKIRAILLALLGASALFSAESSAFKSKSAQAEALNNVQSNLTDAMQNIEGMQSVVAGLSENNQKLSIRISDIESMLKDDVNVQIADIKKNQEEQNEKIDKLTEAVTALGEALGAKGSKAKTQKTDTKAKSEKADKKGKSEKKALIEEEKTTADISKLAPADILAKANKDFQAKKYDSAKEGFSTLVAKGHKPAYSNYMLGEIAYANGQYGEAIGYYKKSVAVYSEGDYMPRLLYHAGISCDKTNQKEQANKFYAALKQTYPDSKEAAAAPDRK